DVVVEKERTLLQDCRDRGVGGQTQGHAGGNITDMVAAAGHLWPSFPPVAAHAQTHGDARRTRDAADAAHDAHGAEYPSELMEAGDQIRHLHDAAVLVIQPCHHYCGIRQVVLLHTLEVEHVHGPQTGFSTIVLQQCAEQRIAIEARVTAPDNL